MKKIISLLLVVALLCSGMANTAFAADTGATTFTVEKVTAAAGDEVTLKVVIANNPGFLGAKFTVTFDSDALTFVSIDDETSEMDGAIVTINNKKSIVSFASSEAITDDGIMFTVTFKVNETATAGEHAVSLTVGKFIDENREAIEYTVVAGGVTVGTATEHTCAPVDVPEVPATCTENGTKAHQKCECGKLYLNGQEVTAADLVIPAGHTLTDVPEVPATCAKEGTKAHQKCSVCGKLFVGGQEVTAADLVIAKSTEHTFGDWTVTKPATETEKGEEKRTCSVCGHFETRETEKLTHTCTLVDVPEVPATCTENGTKAHQKCSCGKLYLNGKEVTAADLVIPAGHKLTDVAEVPATCTENGTKAHQKCSVCGKLFVGGKEVTAADLVIPAAHKLTDVAEVPATCAKEGTKAHQKCSVCGKLFVGGKEVTAADLVIAKTAHTFGEWTVTKPATETEKGEKKRVCSVCNHTETEEIPALTHTCEPVDVAEVPATCTEPGVKAHKKCACGKLYLDGKEVTAADLVIPAGHKLTDVAEVPATCTENGTKAHQKCSVCGKLFVDGKEVTAADLVIPAAHKLTDVAEVPATCAKEGTKAHQKCSVCGKLFVGGKEVTAADLVIAKTAHTFGEWEVTKPATETEKGEKKRVCSVCNHTETEEIPALTHTCEPVDVAEVPATCTEPGVKAHKKCACGKLYLDGKEVTAADLVIPAGHKLTDVAEIPATCAKEGTKAHQKCSVCGKLFVDGKEVTAADLVIAKTAHTFGEWEVTTPATCKDKGVETRTCSVCGETETRETETVGHTWGEWVVTTPATCTENGVETRTCSVCGETETRVIEATGHVDADGDGLCDNCDMVMPSPETGDTIYLAVAAALISMMSIVALTKKKED